MPIIEYTSLLFGQPTLWDLVQSEDVVFRCFEEDRYAGTPLEELVRWAGGWARAAVTSADFSRDLYKYSRFGSSREKRSRVSRFSALPR